MKKRILFAAIFLWLSCFAYSTIQQDILTTSHKNGIQITKICSYALETTKNRLVAFDEKPKDDSFFPILESQLSHLETLTTSTCNIIWLKIDFMIPIDFCQEDLSCYLGRISMHDQTWLNGVYIGGWGTFKKDSWDYWNKTRVYGIPSFLIRNGVKNTLYIRINVNPKASSITIPKIQKSDINNTLLIKENFIYSTSYLLLATLFVFLFICHILFFIQDKNAKESLFYALISLFVVIYTSQFYLLEIPGFTNLSISNLVFQKLIVYSPMYFLLFWESDFLCTIFKQKQSKTVYILKCFFLVLPIVYIFESTNYTILFLKEKYIYLLTMPFFIYNAYIILLAIHNKAKQLVPICLSFIPLLLTSIIDLIIHFKFHVDTIPYISNWGWQLVFLCFGFVLFNNYNKQRIKSENKNIILAKKNHSMAIELNKLQLFNSKNLKKQDEILNTAVYVQKKITPNEIPVLKDWKLAYSYGPRNKIKSTIFDFFIYENNLKGLDLFDLGANSISSALVGMLTKNSIKSCFYEGENLPLHKIMQQINGYVVTENKTIKTSITGILLRVRGNRIEYANAGHPDILHRSGLTGKVRPLTLGSESISGNPIGQSNINTSYKSVAFSMKKNDMLFIYTECLINSTNDRGERFGLKRVIKILAENETEFPSEKLSIMESKIRHFCGKIPLKGELTMLIIQRNPQD